MESYKLKPWTEVAVPHEDILRGELEMSTYAADIGAVARNDPKCPLVYRDPKAFFDATYMTSSLRSVASDVLRALDGKAGDRIIQLRTPFGGGKTHTLIALYHLATAADRLRGRRDLDGIPIGAQIKAPVLSGVDLDPSTGRQVKDGPRLSTLWGELAWQLGGTDAYRLIQKQDEARVAPGGDALRDVFRGRPALVLLDEVFVYVEKAMAIPHHDSTLGRQVMVFLQTLTEVVRGIPSAAMVYSLQKSVHEAAGDAALLASLDHLVSRVDSKREPVSGDEVMRVVQKRLFQKVGDDAIHREVAAAYGGLYRRLWEAGAETGTEKADAAREAEELEKRILESYPFHPDLRDLMYLRWGSLPSYQRTRGALQFLACVVYAQWEGRTNVQPLIGPGDVILSNSAVRSALFSQVGERERFKSVLDSDVTGAGARAANIDDRVARDSPALKGLQVGSRLATASFLYSFGARNGEDRGVTEGELIASCLAPGLDRTVLVAALSDLRERLLYLHHVGRRYRFEPQPNLNKMVADEALRQEEDDVLAQIRARLEKAIGTRTGVAIWPKDASAIPDREPQFTIVYIHPDQDAEHSDETIRQMLENRASGKREFKNAIAFALPGKQPSDVARSAMRTLMGIQALKEQKKKHNFSTEQMEELDEKQHRADEDLQGALRKMYELIRLPVAATTGDVPYKLESIDLRAQPSVGETIQARLLEGLRHWVYPDVKPHKLTSLVKLGQSADAGGRQYVACEQLSKWFFTGLDFPKLLTDQGLKDAIAKGVSSALFGYVPVARVDADGVLVTEHPTLVRMGEMTRSEEIDLSPEAYILAPALAKALRPVAVKEGGEGGGGGGGGGRGDPGGRGGGTSGGSGSGGTGSGGDSGDRGTETTGRTYALRLSVSKGQVFKVWQVLQALSDKAVRLTVSLQIDAEAQDRFDPVWLRNAVEEPLDEADIERK